MNTGIMVVVIAAVLVVVGLAVVNALSDGAETIDGPTCGASCGNSCTAWK